MAREGNLGSELDSCLRAARGSLTAVAIFSAAVNLLMLTGPLFMLQVYDRVLGSRSSSTLLILLIITIYMFVLMGLLDGIRARVLSRIGAEIQQRLDRPVFAACLRAAETSAGDGRPGARGEAGGRDLAAIQALFASPVLGAIFDLPWVPVFIAVLFAFHSHLGIFAVGATLLVVMLSVLNQRLTRTSHAEAARRGAAAEARSNAMRQEIETVRGLGMVGTLGQHWSRAREGALTAGMAASDAGSMIGAATRAIRLLLQSAILALGAWLVLQDQLTGGAIIAASILLGRALSPLEQTIAQWIVVQRAWAARTALNRLFSDHPAPRVPLSLPRPEPQLAVRDLAVIPPLQKKPTLRGVSFVAEAGDVIAVIGPSASGKTTLARALVGLWPAAHGEIRLGGAKLDQFDPDRLGGLMGYLPQKAVLFAGTVAQNIARFRSDAEPSAIVAAATAASAHSLILGLSQGYDTLLSDGGTELSGGQRQRIGLARAFFGDPLVLVLDEPNASLDEQGVLALNRAIATARSGGRIVFVMSHRPSALAEANKVMMIDDGQMRMFGPRDEVLSRVIRNADSIPAAAKRR